MLRLGVDSLRSRHRFEVATWFSLEKVATRKKKGGGGGGGGGGFVIGQDRFKVATSN